MQLNYYFGKERNKHLFYGLLPIVFAVEIFIYSLSLSSTQEELLPFISICVLCILISIVLLIIQFSSIKKFHKKVLKLTRDQIAEIEKRAADTYKMGNLLITSEVILEYRMFIKRIIFIKDIKHARLLDGEMDISSRFSVKVKSNALELMFLSGKKIEVMCPALYTGAENQAVCNIINSIVNKEDMPEKDISVFKDYTVNPPYHGILISVLLGISLFLLWICNNFKYKIIPDDDPVTFLLYHSGFDFIFGIGGVIIFLLVFGMLLFMKTRLVKFDRADWYSSNVYAVIFVISIVLFAGGIVSGRAPGAKMARDDYDSYKNKKFEIIAAKIYEKGGIPNNIDWMDENAIQEYGIVRRYLSIDNDNYILINNNIKFDKEQIYEITFLKYTHIITSIRPYRE